MNVACFTLHVLMCGYAWTAIGRIVFLVLRYVPPLGEMCTDCQDSTSLWYRYSAAKSKRSLRAFDYEGHVVKRGRATVR